MNELMEMYAGVAKVSAEKEKIKLQRDLAKSLNVSQMTDSFMDFHERMLAKDPNATIESSLTTYKQIIETLK